MKTVLIICLFFFGAVYFGTEFIRDQYNAIELRNNQYNEGDHLFHYAKASGNCFDTKFTKGFSFPLFFVSVKHFLKEKTYGVLALVFCLVFLSPIHLRILQMAQLLLLLGLAGYFHYADPKMKRILIMYSVLLLILQVNSWFVAKSGNFYDC